MAFCIKCGAQLEKNAKFCTKCGFSTESRTQEPKKGGYAIKQEKMGSESRTAQKVGGCQKQPVPPQGRPGESVPSKKTPVGLIICIAVAVLAIGAGVVVAVWVNKDKNRTAVQEPEVVYEALPIEKDTETESKTAETETKDNESKNTNTTEKKESKSQSGAVIEPKQTEEKADTSPYPGQKFPYSSDQYLSSSDLAGMSRDEIQLSINDIYARHGYIFKDSALRAYYESQTWYRGTTGDMNAVFASFNSIERANVELMSSYAH